MKQTNILLFLSILLTSCYNGSDMDSPCYGADRIVNLNKASLKYLEHTDYKYSLTDTNGLERIYTINKKIFRSYFIPAEICNQDLEEYNLILEDTINNFKINIIETAVDNYYGSENDKNDKFLLSYNNQEINLDFKNIRMKFNHDSGIVKAYAVDSSFILKRIQ